MKCELTLFFDLTAGLRHRTVCAAARRLFRVTRTGVAAAGALAWVLYFPNKFADNAARRQCDNAPHQYPLNQATVHKRYTIRLPIWNTTKHSSQAMAVV